MMINKECLGLVPDGITKAEAEERIAEIDAKLMNPPKTLLPAAIPVLELERKELKRFLELTPQAKYDARMTRQMSLKFNKRTDSDIIERLDREDNRQSFIKKAIRAYMEDEK